MRYLKKKKTKQKILHLLKWFHLLIHLKIFLGYLIYARLSANAVGMVINKMRKTSIFRAYYLDRKIGNKQGK